MGDLLFEQVTDAGSLARWHAVDVAVLAHDHVGLPADPIEEALPLLSGVDVDSRVELWLGTLDGEPVAAAGLRLPDADNVTTAMVDLHVHPRHRRGGHGARMLALLQERARAERRDRMLFEVAVPLPPPDGQAGGSADAPDSPGAAFARAAGGRPVLTEVRRMLDLDRVDRAVVARRRQEAARHAQGYSLLQWVDRAPEELLGDLADLSRLMATDPPMEDLELEPEAWTPQRYRDTEASAVARGRRRLVTAVRHDASGRLVGYTDIGVNARQGEIAYQWDTIVREDHRGHRLGMLLKAANLELLLERQPGTRYVNTWNAGVNEHMVAINEQLGFVPVDGWQEWQLDL